MVVPLESILSISISESISEADNSMTLSDAGEHIARALNWSQRCRSCVTCATKDLLASSVTESSSTAEHRVLLSDCLGRSASYVVTSLSNRGFIAPRAIQQR